MPGNPLLFKPRLLNLNLLYRFCGVQLRATDMKKTISINISGSIFHIEEDGYDKLKNYLTSIQQYFSSYEDSQEIVTDIENRIAEKLTAKLKAAAVQVVTIDDVNQLIGAMGTVADFEAEEDIVGATATNRQATTDNSGRTDAKPGNAIAQPVQPTYQSQPNNAGQPRVLRRDLRRKTIGGVASGLANYFNVDPVWIRLAFVVLVFGFPSISVGIGHGPGPGQGASGLSGIVFLAYIAMWIAFPGSMTLEDDKSVKKFFRNPDDKVLGGVASGLAAYFGTDTAIIRLVFVLTIPVAGLGFLAYLVLWVISPTAKTLTEKMEMQGQPITLSNIEQRVKTSLNEPTTNDEEGGLTKLLLFPFRAIALIISGLGRVFGPFVSGLGVVIRVFFGVMVLIVAFSLMVASLAALGAAFGIATGAQFGNVPVELIRADLDVPLVLAGFITLFLPAFWLALLGIWLITLRKNLISGRTATTITAVQGVAFLVTALMAGQLANDFRKSATLEEVRTLPLTAQIPVFDLADSDRNDEFEPDIELKSYVGTGLKLAYFRRAKGGSRAEAEANARTIRYTIAQRDSIIRFANEFELTPNSRFRAQDLDIDVFIPVGKPFKLTRKFSYIVARHNIGFEDQHNDMEARIWQFSANGDLICLNFPGETQEESDKNEADKSTAANTDTTAVNLTMNTNELLGDDFDRKGPLSRTFTLDDFTDIETSGAFIVRIKRGDKFSVVADGNERGLDNLTVEVEGNTLKAYRGRNGLFNWTDNERVGLTITMPDIDGLDLSGACRARITGFRNLNELDLDLSGASKAALSVDGVETLKGSLSGASRLGLAGRATNFEADLSGASRITATGLALENADVDASGASRVELGKVSNNYNTETSGAGKVTRQ